MALSESTIVVGLLLALAVDEQRYLVEPEVVQLCAVHGRKPLVLEHEDREQDCSSLLLRLDSAVPGDQFLPPPRQLPYITGSTPRRVRHWPLRTCRTAR